MEALYKTEDVRDVDSVGSASLNDCDGLGSSDGGREGERRDAEHAHDGDEELGEQHCGGFRGSGGTVTLMDVS